MGDVMRNFDLLSGKEKNDYAIRLLAFLDAQARYVETIQKDKSQLVLLKELITKYQEHVNKDLWMTENDLNLKYEVNVGSDGNYQLISTANVGPILLDGKLLPVGIVTLTRGHHQILVERFAVAGAVPELFFTQMGESGVSTTNITFQHISPAKYVAHAQNNSPFFLVLNEQFDRRWKLKIDGKNLPETRHVRANGYANAWYIDSSGSHDVVINYEPYRIFLIAGIISLSGIVGVVAYMILSKRKNKALLCL